MFPVLSALTPRENNQIWLQVRRARKSCQPVLTTCDRHLRGEDNENCLHQCVSSACYDQVYSSEPVSYSDAEPRDTFFSVRSFIHFAY